VFLDGRLGYYRSFQINTPKCHAADKAAFDPVLKQAGRLVGLRG